MSNTPALAQAVALRKAYHRNQCDRESPSIFAAPTQSLESAQPPCLACLFLQCFIRVPTSNRLPNDREYPSLLPRVSSSLPTSHSICRQRARHLQGGATFKCTLWQWRFQGKTHSDICFKRGAGGLEWDMHATMFSKYYIGAEGIKVPGPCGDLHVVG